MGKTKKPTIKEERIMWDRKPQTQIKRSDKIYNRKREKNNWNKES